MSENTTPVSPNLASRLQNTLWLDFDPDDEEKDLALLEQVVINQIKKVNDKYNDHPPIGTTGNIDEKQIVPFSQAKVEEDEEEEDDNDDDEDSSDGEINLTEVNPRGSPWPRTDSTDN